MRELGAGLGVGGKWVKRRPEAAAAEEEKG